TLFRSIRDGVCENALEVTREHVTREKVARKPCRRRARTGDPCRRFERLKERAGGRRVVRGVEDQARARFDGDTRLPAIEVVRDRAPSSQRIKELVLDGVLPHDTGSREQR